MIMTALLMMAIVFMFLPWLDRRTKRSRQEWQARRQRFRQLGGLDEPDDDPPPADSVNVDTAKAGSGAGIAPSVPQTPRVHFDETMNPYQPPGPDR